METITIDRKNEIEIEMQMEREREREQGGSSRRSLQRRVRVITSESSHPSHQCADTYALPALCLPCPFSGSLQRRSLFLSPSPFSGSRPLRMTAASHPFLPSPLNRPKLHPRPRPAQSTACLRCERTPHACMCSHGCVHARARARPQSRHAH